MRKHINVVNFRLAEPFCIPLVAVSFRLIRPLFGNADIGSLLRRELHQFRAELGEMEMSHFLIQRFRNSYRLRFIIAMACII
jgi:hypothetical protein